MVPPTEKAGCVTVLVFLMFEVDSVKKTILTGIQALFFIATIQSCSTDFDINSDNLDTPIVYCILNTADSFQYLRLQKTYLIDQAALEFPPHPDSMVFPGEVVVSLERWQNNEVKETIRFNPTTEIQKDTGFFPTDKHLLYKASARILPKQLYRLYIYLGSKEKVLYAETTTLGSLTVVDPMPLPIRKISLYEGANYTCRWQPVEKAGVYQVVVRFKYLETLGGVTSEKTLIWPQGFSNPGSNIEYLSKDVSGARFMHVLEESLVSKAGIERLAVGLDFQILSGGVELKYYVESTAPSEGALMEKPVYSNVTNGIGLFSSMAEVNISNLFLSSVTLDSMAYGRYTRGLGFLDHTGDRDSTNELKY
ncbi:MAG: hypothetical protein A2X22_08240 [Bacteroidetes bacterium GWF2_49_14]|nr:MAG: hypothetical protein A2X22_08240 [Bacteroidetes bacterium GWF2_49_14]